jgi:hypothetical protein
MKLNMHKLDAALKLLSAESALALVHWDHLISAICGYWLCWNSDNMKHFGRHMAWILGMIVSVHSSGPIAIVPALLGLLLLWGRAAMGAKATVMRLAGTPSLPTIAPVPRHHLAHNLPAHSDSRNLRPLPPGSSSSCPSITFPFCFPTCSCTSPRAPS